MMWHAKHIFKFPCNLAAKYNQIFVKKNVMIIYNGIHSKWDYAHSRY